MLAAYSRRMLARPGRLTRRFTSSNPKQQIRRFTLSSPQQKQGWVDWWLAEKQIPERWTFPWAAEMGLICGVFAVTGTSTMMIVRPAVTNMLQLK